MIDVEVLESDTPAEVGFIFRKIDGTAITAQEALDAMAEVLMIEWGYIPHRDERELDS